MLRPDASELRTWSFKLARARRCQVSGAQWRAARLCQVVRPRLSSGSLNRHSRTPPASWHDGLMCWLADSVRRSGARAQRVLTSGLALWLLGCGASPPEPSSADDVPREASAHAAPDGRAFVDVSVNDDAEAVTIDCEDNAYDDCDAVDNDCNGVIDDGCGYEGGAVQITVGWNSGADIDLYVTDPSGATLYYNEHHKRSGIGGHLDHDARGDCRREQANPRIENAYWPRPARSGNYAVELNYFSPCARAATTEVTLSVVVDSELLGTYRYRLEPEQRVKALSFVKR